MTKQCTEWITDSTDVFFVSQLEDFTLLIDHSFIAPLAKLSAASFDSRVEAGWICRVCDEEDLLSACSDSCDQFDVRDKDVVGYLLNIRNGMTGPWLSFVIVCRTTQLTPAMTIPAEE